jgi:hypothetical protein
MRAGIQRFCSWCGIITALSFFGGFAIAGFLPPPHPMTPPDDLVAIYRDNLVAIRIGMIIWMSSGMFMAFFIGILSEQMRRIESAPSCLYFAQTAAGALNTVFFCVPPAMVLATAYRLERPVEVTYGLNDLSWVVGVLPWAGACAQSFAVGLAILADTNPQPLFARWIGYYNLFCGFAFFLGTGLVFVRQGPFIWRGLFPFWFDGSLFFIWFFIMHIAILRAIKNDPKNAEPSSRPVLA